MLDLGPKWGAAAGQRLPRPRRQASEAALALFTFYPQRPDGSAATFETIELPDDAAALRRARRVLQDHPSSVEVVVWRDEAPIGSVARR